MMINLFIYLILLEQQCNVSLLKSKFVRPSDAYPKDSLHIFPENAPANTTEMTMLKLIDSELYKIQAVVNMSKIKLLQKLIKH